MKDSRTRNGWRMEAAVKNARWLLWPLVFLFWMGLTVICSLSELGLLRELLRGCSSAATDFCMEQAHDEEQT